MEEFEIKEVTAGVAVLTAQISQQVVRHIEEVLQQKGVVLQHHHVLGPNQLLLYQSH